MDSCPYCGARVKDEDRNCSACGGALEPPASSASARAVSTRGGFDQEILDLAKHSKIDAIKKYREMYGVGLKEAKDAVEELMKQHGIVAPAGQGCFTMILLVITLSLGWCWSCW